MLAKLKNKAELLVVNYLILLSNMLKREIEYDQRREHNSK